MSYPTPSSRGARSANPRLLSGGTTGQRPSGPGSRLRLGRDHELGLTIRRVHRDVLRDLALPAVAVVQELLLVVEQLFARLDRELVVRTLHDGVHRAGLLAIATVDALHHVDVVAGGAARAVVAPRPRLDCDGLRRADSLAKLAG